MWFVRTKFSNKFGHIHEWWVEGICIEYFGAHRRDDGFALLFVPNSLLSFNLHGLDVRSIMRRHRRQRIYLLRQPGYCCCCCCCSLLRAKLKNTPSLILGIKSTFVRACVTHTHNTHMKMWQKRIECHFSWLALLPHVGGAWVLCCPFAVDLITSPCWYWGMDHSATHNFHHYQQHTIGIWRKTFSHTHVKTNPTTAAASYPAGVRWQNSIRLENFDWPRQMIEVAFRHTRRMAETWIEFLNCFWASMRKKPNHFTPMPFFLFFLMCSTVAMSIWASTPHIRTVKYYIEFSEL